MTSTRPAAAPRVGRRVGRHRRPRRARTVPEVGAASGWIAAALMGAVWSAAVFLVLITVWGGPDHVAFGSPDEALTRHAIQQVVRTGSPAVEPPIPDPEGLFAQRLWAVYEGRAIPTHAPFLFFLYAAPERLVEWGRWVVLVFPSLGLGALVSAVALLLPRRKWLALLVPGLGFPLTFRFLKPWENMAAMSAAMAVALLLWVVWYRTRRPGWMYAALAALTVAASIRPDQVHVLFGLSLLWALVATRGPERRWLVVLHLVGGAAVVLGVLVQNAVVTGDPLLPPVYLLQGEPGTEIAGKGLPPGISHAVSLLLPKGIPDPDNVVFQTRKYWWELGPIAFVTVAAVLAFVGSVVVGLVSRRYRLVAGLTATGLLLVGYYLSRINRTDWGAASLDPSIGHSLPRYSAVVYAAVVVGVVYAVSRLPRGLLGLAGSLALAWVAVAGLLYLYEGEVRTSLKDATPLIQTYERYAANLDRAAPADALFYVRFTDKFVWSVRPTAVIPTEPGVEKANIRYGVLADSLARAIADGFRPIVFELTQGEASALEGRLGIHGLELAPWEPGYDQEVVDLLVRWSAWKVVARG